MVIARRKLCFVFILAFANFKCGVTEVEISSQVGELVYGNTAAVNSAPFIVSFQQNGVHYCAGSILNQNWVVTAAHCLKSEAEVMGSTLVAGSNKVDGTASTTQKRSICYFVVHDLHLGGRAPYDIGLVYTKKPFEWTAAVAAVTLPSSGTSPTDSGTLYGWGSTSTTDAKIFPKKLKVATVSIITLNECETALGTDVHFTHLCTGSFADNAGSVCTSDSGGPLVQKNVLIGIVSWGNLPCGQRSLPSVFVQVSSFITWIAENQEVPSTC